MAEQGTRIERDSMGEMEVPGHALYGATTARAILNFPISGIAFSRSFLRALGLIKAAAATVNGQLGLLPEEKVRVIVAAANEVAAGEWDDHFPIDIFQTGSGTSTNMNANEVIANRAERAGRRGGEGASERRRQHVPEQQRRHSRRDSRRRRTGSDRAPAAGASAPARRDQ